MVRMEFMFKAPENRNAARMAQAIHDIDAADDRVTIDRALEIKRLWNESVQRDLTKLRRNTFRAWLARTILG